MRKDFPRFFVVKNQNFRKCMDLLSKHTDTKRWRLFMHRLNRIVFKNLDLPYNEGEL